MSPTEVSVQFGVSKSSKLNTEKDIPELQRKISQPLNKTKLTRIIKEWNMVKTKMSITKATN